MEIWPRREVAECGIEQKIGPCGGVSRTADHGQLPVSGETAQIIEPLIHIDFTVDIHIVTVRIERAFGEPITGQCKGTGGVDHEIDVAQRALHAAGILQSEGAVFHAVLFRDLRECGAIAPREHHAIGTPKASARHANERGFGGNEPPGVAGGAIEEDGVGQCWPPSDRFSETARAPKSAGCG